VNNREDGTQKRKKKGSSQMRQTPSSTTTFLGAQTRSVKESEDKIKYYTVSSLEKREKPPEKKWGGAGKK